MDKLLRQGHRQWGAQDQDRILDTSSSNQSTCWWQWGAIQQRWRFNPSEIAIWLPTVSESPIAKLKARRPARSILLQLDTSRGNVLLGQVNFDKLAARISALKKAWSSCCRISIVVDIDESLFVQFDNCVCYHRSISLSAVLPEKPLKAPKVQKKEYDEVCTANLRNMHACLVRSHCFHYWSYMI
jgi:hypothetical protein